MSSVRSHVRLTPEQEAEAKILEERIRHAAGEEFKQLARLMVSKKTHEIFGQTEMQVRDILLRVGAKVYEEYLREKKTATKEQALPVPAVSRRPNSRATVPRSR
jgi:parvulin-like peptidyl-prolyl isomerase